MLQWIELAPLGAIEFGLMMVVLIEMIIGGRIVPAFTAGAIPGVRGAPLGVAQPGCDHRCRRGVRVRRVPRARAWVIALASVLTAPERPFRRSAGIRWQRARNRSCWILHAAYTFIPIGLILLGVSWLNFLPRTRRDPRPGRRLDGRAHHGHDHTHGPGPFGPPRACDARRDHLLHARAARGESSRGGVARFLREHGAHAGRMARRGPPRSCCAVTYAPILCRARATT